MKIKFFLFVFPVFFWFTIVAEKAFAQAPTNTPAECSTAGGKCVVTPSGDPGETCGAILDDKLLGYCNPVTKQVCCKSKIITSGQGSDEHCANTLKGNCRTMASGGCFKGVETSVGACTLGPGIPPKTRVCCASITAPPITVTGPPLSNYRLLEGIPGSSAPASDSGKLNVWLEDIYRFAFWAVGIAVVFMLTIGGFMYLTSAGNTSRIGTAKTIIFDAILGLILALVAWIFLYIINPDLVKVKLPSSLPATSIPTPPATPPVSSDIQGIANQILSGSTGVSLYDGGDCSASAGVKVSPQLSVQQMATNVSVIACQDGCPGTGYCTKETTLSERMLKSLVSVSVQYPMEITSFTGGDHSPSSVHYQGRAADIKPRSSKATWPDVIQVLRGTTNGLIMCDANGRPVDCSVATHIHAEW